jgi:hypothetical protein
MPPAIKRPTVDALLDVSRLICDQGRDYHSHVQHGEQKNTSVCREALQDYIGRIQTQTSKNDKLKAWTGQTY